MFGSLLAKILVTVVIGVPVALLVCLTIRWCKKILKD